MRYSEERSDEESTISPPPGSDRGMQNDFAAMIRPPKRGHSERIEIRNVVPLSRYVSVAEFGLENEHLRFLTSLRC